MVASSKQGAVVVAPLLAVGYWFRGLFGFASWEQWLGAGIGVNEVSPALFTELLFTVVVLVSRGSSFQVVWTPIDWSHSSCS